MDRYADVNRASWDERVPAHLVSPDYQISRFTEDPDHLSEVVRFDLPRLGDIRGLRGVHLQCHIGTDTISLARLGASMTGLDFSAPAVAAARDLATRTAADAQFVQGDVYAAPDLLGRGEFGLVYTGIGALCWLPDIRRWAGVVAALLEPGGRLFLREGHPMLWAVADERDDGLLVVEYPYFERPEPTVFHSDATYATTDVVFENTETHEWNHGLAEIITALMDAGLELTALAEHDSSPWAPFPGMMEKSAEGEWRLTDRPWRLPCTYTLQAVRRS
jgi:SAM-dependent methyltransferase